MTKATRLTVRLDDGSTDGQVEEFPLAEDTELLIGWDSASAIRFAEDEDLVSREHAKIVTRGEGASRVEILDLDSGSGTFVNQQRVTDFMVLRTGDVVHVGAGGPEMRLDLEFETAQKVEEAATVELDDAFVESTIPDALAISTRRRLMVGGAFLLFTVLVVLFLVLRT